MDLDTYAGRLRELLFPKVYPRDVATAGSHLTLLLLQKRRWYSGRYAFALAPWSAELPANEQLERARSDVARLLGAWPLVRQVGLFVVFSGPRDTWSHAIAALGADQTGLRTVIVQGIHWVDLETGRQHVNASAWGPVRFGGVDSVASAIWSLGEREDDALPDGPRDQVEPE